MRIVSLHISNFGKLNNFNLTFENGLNSLVKENGFGKTTLAVFIKCMFYGIKGGNKSNLSDENERIKYYTWETNKLIGGTLDFELDGETYHIERYFGSKPSEDTFKITNLKTNKPANFSENLGEEIFGIDVNGFERTTYIPQKIVDFKKDTNTLSTKLVNLTYSTDSVESVDEVIDKLEIESKKYFKLSGKSGLIAEAKNNISNLEIKIHECATFEESAKLVQEDIEKVESEIEEINLKLNNLQPQIEKAVASNAVLDEYNKILRNIEITNNRIIELKHFFNDNIINPENLNSLIDLAQELNKIENQIEVLSANVAESQIKEYSNRFKNETPDLEQIDNYIKLCDNILNNQNTNVVDNKNSDDTKILLKDPSVWFYSLLVTGLLLIGLSITCFFINTTLGLVFLAFALILTGGSFVLKAKTKNINKETLSNVETEEIKQIEEYLTYYGYNTSNIKQSLMDLRSDVLIYLNLLNAENNIYEKINTLELRGKEITNECTSFLNLFYDKINATPFELLVDVKNNYIELEGLTIKLIELEKDLKSISKKVDTSLNLEELKSNQEKLLTRLKLYQNEKQKLLNSKNNFLERSNLKQDFIQQLAFEKENFNKYFNKYNTITSTINYLKQAKDSVCSKYLKPLTDNFVKHLNNVSNNLVSNISIDAEFNINIIDNTLSRNIEYYSKGYKDLLNICLRFALVDTLFEKTKPFVILDDPFINLDDNKFKDMVNIIEKLSQNYQIIYLTCSSSRG